MARGRYWGAARVRDLWRMHGPNVHARTYYYMGNRVRSLQRIGHWPFHRYRVETLVSPGGPNGAIVTTTVKGNATFFCEVG